MKTFLEICQTFETKDGVVVGGANDDLNYLTNEQITKLFLGAKNLYVDGALNCSINVIDVKITESMWGKKNIFLLISNSVPASDIKVGGRVEV